MKTAYDSEKLTEQLKIDMAILGNFDLWAFSHLKKVYNQQVYTEYTIDDEVNDRLEAKDSQMERMSASQLLELLNYQNKLIYQ
jgi:hypothetical protein